MSDTSGQRDTLARAAEQYREITRLDPADTDARYGSRVSTACRTSTINRGHSPRFASRATRENENASSTSQLCSIREIAGGHCHAQGILDRAPVPRLWDLYGRRVHQIHRFGERRAGIPTKASEAQPGASTTPGLRANSPKSKKNFRKPSSNISVSRKWILKIPTTMSAWPRFTSIETARQGRAKRPACQAAAPGNLEVIYTSPRSTKRRAVSRMPPRALRCRDGVKASRSSRPRGGAHSRSSSSSSDNFTGK